jgi:hypothetical protein
MSGGSSGIKGRAVPPLVAARGLRPSAEEPAVGAASPATDATVDDTEGTLAAAALDVEVRALVLAVLVGALDAVVCGTSAGAAGASNEYPCARRMRSASRTF